MNPWPALVFCACLAACATVPEPQRPENVLADALFTPPVERINAADVFALSPAMRDYMNAEIATQLRTKGRQQGLVEALYNRGQLKIEYDAGITRNAAEAFDARAGNCLSLVIMTAAFAKELGLAVRYQNVFVDETWSRSGDFYLSIGHVNLSLGRKQVQAEFGRNETDTMVIDFLPPVDIRGQHTWVIDESTIVAMYMNNRAVESLTTGQVNEAYWWSREAILQDPRFLSAYNTLGVIYQAHRNFAQAETVLNYVLAREPGNTRVISNLASVLHDEGRIEASLELTRKLERMEPNPPFGYFKQGLAAMQVGNYKAAKDLFTKEVDRAAYYHEFHFWLALAYVGLGEMDQARIHMAIAEENSTTRKDHDLYAAKLARLRSEVPVIRR